MPGCDPEHAIAECHRLGVFHDVFLEGRAAGVTAADEHAAFDLHDQVGRKQQIGPPLPGGVKAVLRLRHR